MALSTLLMGTTTAQASAAVPFDANAKVAYSLSGATVQCGDTLTHHTKLTRDLNCPGTVPYALRVAAAGVVLDLGGYTVRRTGPQVDGSQGIVVEADSMVRNGTIQGFNYGLVGQLSALHVRLHKLALLDHIRAVYDRGATNFLITECRLSGNVAGLGNEFDASNGTFDVRSSVFTHNGTAMFADFHNIDVLDSTFTSNGNVVYCWQGNVRFRSSMLAWNASVSTIPNDGAGPRMCSQMRFENTLIANNTAFAPPTVPVWEPLRLSMINSMAVNNGSSLQAAAETVYIDGNTFYDNAGGLILSDRPGVVTVPLTGIVRGNQFLSNDGDGLRVLAPSTPTVIGNVALGNTGFGIYAPTAFDGGGNVARDNGAGDCVGIFCTPY
ncbi:right-handed parallel beta-helix repeat-containing protein [Corallococcus llansteffanensis]